MQDNYPLIELHRHLEGCLRPETIIDLARQHGLTLPAWTVDELLPFLQVGGNAGGVMAYISKFELFQYVMVDHEAVRRITFEAIEDAHLEGIHYLELRFSPIFMAEKHDLDPKDVVAAVCEGLAEARGQLPIRAKLIGIMSRTYGADTCMRELEAILTGRDRGIVAVDLAGDERNYPAELFVEHFDRARDAGFRITVHAGESGSADQVWQAINKLGAERLGHAVRAIGDPALMEHIAEHSIGVESCLTSNMQTGVVPAISQHPLPAFLREGIPVTLNTDSPTISDVDINHEFDVAREQLGLSEPQLAQIRENALQIAFLSDHERAELLSLSE